MNEHEQQSSAPRYRSASRSKLPKASAVLDDQELFQKAAALLAEATDLRVQQSILEEREQEVRDELAAICEAYKICGLRHGLNAFEYYGYVTRKSLSKEMLLARGVSAEDIAASYVDSKPFLSCKVNPFDVE